MIMLLFHFLFTKRSVAELCLLPRPMPVADA